MRLARLYPKNAEQARGRLTQVIDEHAERIKQIRAVHSEIMAADAVRAAERLAYDSSPEGDKARRYTLAHERRYLQTIATFLKARKSTNDGTRGDTDSGLGSAVPIAAPAQKEPIHTSPFDCAQGGPTRQRETLEIVRANGAKKVPFIGARSASQMSDRTISCGETDFAKRPGRALRLRSVQAHRFRPTQAHRSSTTGGAAVSAARTRHTSHERSGVAPGVAGLVGGVASKRRAPLLVDQRRVRQTPMRVTRSPSGARLAFGSPKTRAPCSRRAVHCGSASSRPE
jgi:hypothetical protein